MNLVLVGFMGSGKTAVGRRIARRLGYGFLDTDHIIEQAVGCTIAELFENKGESTFREMETRLADTMSRLDNHVVSTGGGMLTTEGNLERLREAGLVVFLNADRGEILERLSRDTRRPKLKEGDLEQTVNRLLDERLPRYLLSDIVLGTKGKSVNRVAGEIIAAIPDARDALAKGRRGGVEVPTGSEPDSQAQAEQTAENGEPSDGPVEDGSPPSSEEEPVNEGQPVESGATPRAKDWSGGR